jgi:hypothetical protein
VEAAEERIASGLDRLAREIRSVKLAQQALFAFVDSLVKTLLTCPRATLTIKLWRKESSAMIGF